MSVMHHHTSMNSGNHQGRTCPRSQTRLPNVEIRRFGSLLELGTDLESLSRSAESDEFVVVLALYKHFAGDLSTLIDRSHPAGQLIVTTADHSVPEPIFLSAIAARQEELRWKNIEFHHDVIAVMDDALRSIASDRRCVIYWPEWPEWLDHSPIHTVIDKAISHRCLVENQCDLRFSLA